MVMMKISDNVIRIFTGLFFIFSGLLKINDPVGTSLKLKEYFEVFSADFSVIFQAFVPVALELAVLVIVLEVVLGVALLVSYRMKTTVWVLMGLVVFFTFLTFYSAYFEKVTDCGCFGEVIPLTPWQSFYKDIFLLILIGYLFFRRNRIQPLVRPRTGDAIIAFSFALNIGIAVYAIRHLPYIDFLPYHVGADIQQYMKPSEPFRYKFIMEREGKRYDFDLFPADTTYQFREMVLLNPNAAPRITDYNVWNEEGDYTLETFIGSKVLVIIENVRKSNKKGIQKVKALADDLSSDVEILILTATDEQTFELYRHEFQLAIPYYYADATVLETMIRSNPGIMVLHDGVVMGKWHHNKMPTADQVRQLIRKKQ
jgi:uncharacterized membrane protein YphA (DoxX/SURF4 family)